MLNQYHPENYWDTVADQISSRPELKIIAGDDEPYYRYKRQRFLELLSKIDFSAKTVLEIGSGPGGNLDFIYNKGCAKITGVDISQKMVTLSSNLLKGKDIDIIKINGKDLPFENNSFDIVFTSTVLQHNTDEASLLQLIKEICRVSKDEVLIFERIEKKVKGHESNIGRPVGYYENIFGSQGFSLKYINSLPIQASYFVSGVIRKIFNRSDRKEGEPLSAISIFLQKVTLPITSILDRFVLNNRDVMLLSFIKTLK